MATHAEHEQDLQARGARHRLTPLLQQRLGQRPTVPSATSTTVGPAATMPRYPGLGLRIEGNSESQ
jgi:hypothetical protein